MSGPLSKAPPPPPSPAVLAQRRRQTRLVVFTLLGMFVLLLAWQIFEYVESAPERAQAKLQEGISLLRPGTYDQAILRFDEALELNPNLWSAYLQRGSAQQNLGKLDEALEDFQKTLVLKPDALEARVASAGIYGDKGNTEQEVEELAKVLELRPDVDAYYRRGTALAKLGRHEEAIKDFTAVIDQTRDAPLAYFARANSRRALGDLDGATEDTAAAQSFDRGKFR